MRASLVLPTYFVGVVLASTSIVTSTSTSRVGSHEQIADEVFHSAESVAAQSSESEVAGDCEEKEFQFLQKLVGYENLKTRKENETWREFILRKAKDARAWEFPYFMNKHHGRENLQVTGQNSNVAQQKAAGGEATHGYFHDDDHLEPPSLFGCPKRAARNLDPDASWASWVAAQVDDSPPYPQSDCSLTTWVSDYVAWSTWEPQS